MIKNYCKSGFVVFLGKSLFQLRIQYSVLDILLKMTIFHIPPIQIRRKFVCPGHQPIFNAEVIEANFNDVDAAYELEKAKPLKIAYKLNDSVLCPKSIEKTSVNWH